MQERLKKIVSTAIAELHRQMKLPLEPEEIAAIKVTVERTRSYKHGDYTTKVAMSLARKAEMQPYDLASLLVSLMPKDDYIDKIEVAGTGFINFHLTQSAFHKVVVEVLRKGESFGRSDVGQGKSAIIEFVSSNPTGPLHVGHGRGAAYGASLADILEAMGYKVHREYYVNDHGRQMQILTVSVWLRYLQLSGEVVHLPNNFYRGDYVVEIARRLRLEHGERLRRSMSELYADMPSDSDEGGDPDYYIDVLVERSKDLLGMNDFEIIFQRALTTILKDIREDLEEFGVVYQEWFYESNLHKNGDVERSIAKLRSLGHIYEQDGATWFRATSFGDEKDRVVIRENGQYTYFASDIAYHFNKYERGFDLLINVLGADHFGYAPRIRGFLSAAGLDISKLVIPIVQFAILYRGKTKVPMSTRGGAFVTLRKLREEVGNDAARFFYVMRKNDQHLDFDLELAKSQSKDNPVYYIQYAHARICSVMRQLEEKNLEWEKDYGLQELQLLCTQHEEHLLRTLSRFSETLKQAALKYQPHLLTHYLQELANDFHSYYNAQQFIVNDGELRNARLCLIVAVQQVLKNGLFLLGVSAPETM